MHGRSVSARQLPANALHNTKVADIINGLKTGSVISPPRPGRQQ
ncbi:hypothetical protein [Morganella morganii IS15]|nr:hypothetical protein CSB69_1271 [Morganella morganii]EMP50698.1 hypothetical protein C790_02078 [Morganella morganii SC01]CDK67341.1 hypothetical protein [Morganella morganii IS15]